MKQNNLFERLFYIKAKDVLKLNNICLIQTKYLWAKTFAFFIPTIYFLPLKKKNF